jgi:hypothetical protein
MMVMDEDACILVEKKRFQKLVSEFWPELVTDKLYCNKAKAAAIRLSRFMSMIHSISQSALISSTFFQRLLGCFIHAAARSHINCSCIY